MIAVGTYNELEILRETSVGLFLGDEAQEEDVLLPNKYCPKQFEIGDKLDVFVYRDYEDRKIATNLTPKIFLNEFAFLKVVSVSNVGAFLDWGLEKDLMVPFKEQRQKMQEGRWYIVYLDLDERTDRLFASNKIEHYLQNHELTVEEKQEVDLMVMQKTDLGYSVIVNGQHKGLVYENQVFRSLQIGQSLKGYVKEIREDNKLDISLQPIGYEQFNDINVDTIYRALLDQDGYMLFTDKSSPEEIYDAFGMSKKAFKKAVGALYKAQKISIEDRGIRLL